MKPKNLIKILFGLSAVLTQTAGASPFEQRLLGGWDLRRFEIIAPNGDHTPFCDGVTGLLLYDRSGHVSVSINCAPHALKDGKTQPADAYNSMLFYAGTFEVSGDSVIHKITNSSVTSLIGKEAVRKVERLTETELVLTGAFGTHGDTLRIEWSRESAIPPAAHESFALFSHIKVKPGSENRFIEEVQAIIEPSRQEPGNIAWFVQQSQSEPTEFIFYTRWINEAALSNHLNSAPLKAYLTRTAPLLAEPAKLVRYTPIDLSQNSDASEVR